MELKMGIAVGAGGDYKPATEDGKPTATDDRDRGTTA
jgi:hypothetical protein